MQTINQTISNTYEVNRSKFIAYLTPIENFKALREQLKADNPKANHVVYATRQLNEYDQVVENSSDDGEPKGCAGVPSLSVLRGHELINVALLTVRYFGGIRLGTGGMVRAYGNAVKEVLAIAPLQPYQKQIEFRFTTPYNQVDQTLYHLKQLDINTFERDFGMEGVEWIVRSNQESIDGLKEMVLTH